MARSRWGELRREFHASVEGARHLTYLASHLISMDIEEANVPGSCVHSAGLTPVQVDFVMYGDLRGYAAHTRKLNGFDKA
jgi:hypothetical protein